MMLSTSRENLAEGHHYEVQTFDCVACGRSQTYTIDVSHGRWRRSRQPRSARPVPGIAANPVHAADRSVRAEAGEILTRCPQARLEVPTGLDTHMVVFRSLPNVAIPLHCPAWRQVHVWTPAEAWIGNRKAELAKPVIERPVAD
jgi:hypothetical protein